ncbi:hypothetical protein NUW54_g6397 [Trametes sanguinea]|uniref:Uncharacterized protein n=1 Tax=Trametes sanguinea TaxID=158606 RepID=A0ACC1PSC9_9APHY|nr:hypothetical protein NUW54_g6397 [Trametes sanguinea]
MFGPDHDDNLANEHPSMVVRPSEESDQVDQLDEAAYAAPALVGPATAAGNRPGQSLDQVRVADVPLGHLLEVLTDCDRCRDTAHKSNCEFSDRAAKGCRACLKAKRTCSWGRIGMRGEVYGKVPFRQSHASLLTPRISAKQGPKTKVLARFNGSGLGIVKRTETDWAAVFEAVESATDFLVKHGVVVLDATALAAKTSDCSHARSPDRMAGLRFCLSG